jgi:hypothetical protein
MKFFGSSRISAHPTYISTRNAMNNKTVNKNVVLVAEIYRFILVHVSPNISFSSTD